MKRITIEIPEAGDRHGGFDVVLEDGRRCNGLNFDEMLGQVIGLAHRKLGHHQYRMESQEYWDKRFGLVRLQVPQPATGSDGTLPQEVAPRLSVMPPASTPIAAAPADAPIECCDEFGPGGIHTIAPMLPGAAREVTR